MSKSASTQPSAPPAPSRADAGRPEPLWVSPEDFEGSVGIAVARAEAGVPHALFVLHVERLAEIGGRCGREAETALLDLVALVLTNLIGDGYPLCRLADDRVALIQGRCAPSRVPGVARQMRSVLEGGVFVWRSGRFRLGVNVGAAVLVPAPGGPGALIRRAREACVAARELGGRGCVLMDGTERQRIQLERERIWIERLRETIG